MFISYAREDSSFVERLYERLVGAGRTAYVDTRGIPVWSPDWQQELYEAIEGADAFLFVLSDDALKSPNVGLELRHALEHGKRIKPLQVREVDESKLDDALRTPQWIDFRREGFFEERFSDLLEFLDTDVEWVRRHSRLGVRASEWTSRGEDRSLLLGKTDLAEAEAWLAQSDGKEPPPTPLQRRYVEASVEDARRRRRIRNVAIAVGVSVAAVLGAVALLQYRSAGASGESAESRRVAAAAVAALANDPAEALRLAVQAARVDDTVQARSVLRRALSESFSRTVLDGGDEAVSDAEFSPDGSLVVTRAFDGVRVWDVPAGRQRAHLQRPTPIDAFGFSQDGSHLVTVAQAVERWDLRTGKLAETLRPRPTERRIVEVAPGGEIVGGSGFDGTLTLWSAESATPIAVRRVHIQQIGSIAFSPDAEFAATAGDDPVAWIWDAQSGAPFARLAHGARVNDVAFSADGSLVATAGSDGTVQIFARERGERLHVLRGHTEPVGSVAFAPDGALVLSTAQDDTARIWDVRTGILRAELRGHSDSVSVGAFSDDGRVVVTAGFDGTARVWDASSGALRAVLRGHSEAVTAASFEPNGRRVLTASSDGTARIWEPPREDPVTVVGEPGPSSDVDFSPDGRRVLSSQGLRARLWNVADGRVLRTFGGRGRWLDDAALSGDGRYVATAMAYGQFHLWSATTGRQLALLEERHGMGNAARFSPDGRYIVTTGPGDEPHVWRVPSGAPVAGFKAGSCRSTVASFSPDGARLALACDRDAVVRDVERGTVVATLRGHTDAVNAVAFSRDGERVVTGSSDSSARIWDAGSGEQLELVRGHRAPFISVAFGPRDERILTASHDGTARIWDGGDGEPLAVLRHAQLSSAAFSADGALVVTAGGDGAVRVWESATGEQVDVVRSHAGPAKFAVFGPSEPVIVSTGADRTARVVHCRLCIPTAELIALAERSLPRLVRAEASR